MQKNYIEKLTEAMTFLLLTAIFYFYNNYVTIGGFGVGYQYVVCILIIGIGMLLLLVKAEVPPLYHSVKAAEILALPYFVSIIYSSAIWIFNFTPIRQMISGFFEPAYMILCIFCAAFLCFILREKTVLYSFWALMTAFGLLVAQKIMEFGISGFLHQLIEYVRSGGQDSGGVSLEGTSFAYSYVFFALYFIFNKKGEAWWKMPLRMLLILFGMLEVFKRSGFLALAAAFVVSFLYSRCRGRYQKWLINFAVVCFILFAFLYIPFIRYGFFNQIAEARQIDTSARTRIYNYYARYYEFSPYYSGKGLGWVARLLERAERFNTGLEAVNVHCDYVRLYIELGFWGYLCWLLTAFPWVIKKAVRGISTNDDAVILGVCIAMAVLRLTENISQLYSAVFTMSIVIIQCIINGKRKAVFENSEMETMKT